MQYVCRYGIDDANPAAGIVVADYPDDTVVDMSTTEHAGCVLIPSPLSLAELPKYGPEPKLLGDPPTGTYPDHAELDREGIPKFLIGKDGEPLRDEEGDKIPHPFRLRAGKPYPDRRLREIDWRPRAAPSQSDIAVQRAYLAHVRWAKEVGGITVDGFPASTARETRQQTEADASRAARDPKFGKKVKGTDGKFYDLDADKLVKVADAVSDHVQACFDTEAKLLPDIAAGKVKDFWPIDEAFAKL